MIRTSRGFTLVEILIAIVVIGILVGISSVAFNGVVAQSNDRARANDVKQWAATFDLYKSRFVVWPGTPAANTNTIICLGSYSTPGSRCGQYTGLPTQYRTASGTEWTNLKSAVEKVGKWPTNSGPNTKNLVAGPVVYLQRSSAGTTINAAFVGFFEQACPADIPAAPTTGNYAALGAFITGLPSGVTACAITKTLNI